jgi:serine/threonine protein kinase
MMYYIEPREKMGIQTFICQHNMLNKLINKDSQFLRTIVCKVAEALEQIHSLNYIHCNLKLKNVVVKLDDFQKIEKVKLIGFGDVF